jgi:hypothetical protein
MSRIGDTSAVLPVRVIRRPRQRVIPVACRAADSLESIGSPVTMMRLRVKGDSGMPSGLRRWHSTSRHCCASADTSDTEWPGRCSGRTAAKNVAVDDAQGQGVGVGGDPLWTSPVRPLRCSLEMWASRDAPSRDSQAAQTPALRAGHQRRSHVRCASGRSPCQQADEVGTPEARVRPRSHASSCTQPTHNRCRTALLDASGSHPVGNVAVPGCGTMTTVSSSNCAITTGQSCDCTPASSCRAITIRWTWLVPS